MVTLILIRWGIRIPNLLNYALMALHSKVDKVILVVPAKHAGYVRWYLNSFYEYLSKRIMVVPMVFNVNFASIKRRCIDIPNPYITAYPDVKLLENVVQELSLEGVRRDDVIFNTPEPFWLGTYVVARNFVSKGFGVLTISSLENVLSLPIRLVWKTITNKTMQWIDKIIAHTFTSKRFLLKLGLEECKIEIVHLGIDTKMFAPKSFENPKEGLTFLFIGRLDPEKGIKELVTAWRKMNASPKRQLVFVGDGSLRGSVIELARSFQNVRYLGFITSAMLPKAYHSGDVFLYLSKPKYLYGMRIWEEQFGFAPVEALASGLKVIATSCGALPEVIPSPPNILIDADDVRPKKIAAILTELSNTIRAEELKENAVRNRLIVERYYNIWNQSLKLANSLLS